MVVEDRIKKDDCMSKIVKSQRLDPVEKTKRTNAGRIFLCFFSLFFLLEAAMGIEQPKFSVLMTEGDFELRQMGSYAVAETEVRATFKDAGK